MKKVLIALLAVLLLLSFTSCEKDKSEEVIAAYEEFCKAQYVSVYTYGSFDYPDSGDVDIKSLTKDDVEDYNVYNCLNHLDGTKLYSVDAAEGAVKGKVSQDEKEVTYTGVKITYYVEGDSATKHELTIDGTFKCVEETGDSEAMQMESSLTINGKDFAFSFTINNKGKYTAASVNGKDVNLTLLNSKMDNTWYY